MLAIVPPHIKRRVSLFFVLGAFVLAGPWFLLVDAIWIPIVLEMLLIAIALYVTWCFWPKANWGIPKSLLGDLPLPPHQNFRLSFDDGPTPGLTDQVLDILKATNTKASFFVLIGKARACPQLLKRMLDEGHEVGLHGEDHRSPFFRSSDELTDSLVRAKKELEQLIGRQVVYYRPSHGWKNINLILATKRASLKLSNWDYGVWDTQNPTVEILLERLRQVSDHVSNSSTQKTRTVLLHDGKNDDPAVPDHAQTMIDTLKIWLRDPSPKLLPALPSTSSFGLKQAAGLLVCVALLGIIFWKIDFGELSKAIANISLVSLLGVFVCNFLCNFFQGLRFYFLWPYKNVSWLKHVGLNFTFHTGNAILPFKTGEALRPLILRKWDSSLSFHELIFWTLADKMLEAAAFLPFLATAAYSFGLPWGWVVAISAVGLVAMIVWWKKSNHANPRNLFLASACSLLVWVSMAAAFWFILPGFTSALGLLTSTTLASSIPAGPAGVGTFEAAFTWFAHFWGGLTPEVAFAYAIAVHFTLVLSTSSVGVPCLAVWGWPKSSREAMTRIKVPLRYRFTNIFVWGFGCAMILCSRAVWIPKSRLPVKKDNQKEAA